MSENFEFLCQHCEQRFRVAVERVGARLKCPRCQQITVVPSPEIGAVQLATRAARQQADPSQTFAEFTVYDDPAATRQAPLPPSPSGATAPPAPRTAPPAPPPPAPPAPHPQSPKADLPVAAASDTPTDASLPPQHEVDEQGAAHEPVGPAQRDQPHAASPPPPAHDPLRYVTVPRGVLYMQASLLVFVAVVAFVLGSLFGGCGGEPIATVGRERGPSTLSGTVTYRDGGPPRPDVGAVVLVMPRAEQPQEPLPSAWFMPTAVLPGGLPAEDRQRADQALFVFGGGYAVVAADGRFSVELVEPGDYQVLVLSVHQDQPRHLEPTAAQLATIGRYFRPAFDLLETRAYSLQSVDLPRAEPLKIEF